MNVETLTPATWGDWDAYVDGHGAANNYHLRAWQTVAQRAYGLDAPFLIARQHPGGPVQGVLPLFVVPGVPGVMPVYLTTGLFGAYGPILCESAAAATALIDEAQRLGKRARAGHLVFKSLGADPVLAARAAAGELVRRDTAVIATMPLSPDPQVMWKRVRDTVRNKIRKAQKHDLIVRSGVDQIPGYHDVLAENMHVKGTPIYGVPFMRELVLGLGDRAEVLTLSHGGQVVSAALLVYYHDAVCVPFASSRPSALHMGPNNLLYWEIIQRACRRGMKLFDFGRSPKDSTTLAFKLSWGAQVTPMPFYLYPFRGEAPAMDPNDETVQRMVRLWQRLPRKLADALGPQVCRRVLV